MHEHGVIVSDKGYVSHHERFLHIETQSSAVVTSEVNGGKSEVNVVGVGCGVGKECDILLGECEVALVSQVLSNLRAPFVEVVMVEDVSGLDGEVQGVGKNLFSQSVVRDVVTYGADDVWPAQRDIVGYPGFLLGGIERDVGCDLVFHVSAVAYGEIELMSTGDGERGVEDYGSRSDFLNPPVEPRSGVFAGEIINGELEFEPPENFVVLVLSEISGEIALVEIGCFVGIGNVDSYAVEQILTLRDMLGVAARRERNRSGANRQEASHFHIMEPAMFHNLSTKVV